MQTFLAANNLLIEYDETYWRLKSASPDQPAAGSPGAEAPLVEADADGLQYHPLFARARRLPEGGLKPYHVEMVIVGWENQVWHLGVLLAPHLATQRGGRWCGIAKWTDPTGASQAETARHAGELLAYALQKPFQFVPAAVAPSPAAAPFLPDQPAPLFGAPPRTGPVTATRSLLSPAEQPPSAALSAEDVFAQLPALPGSEPIQLPLHAGDWTLSEIGRGLRWSRSAAWRRGVLLRGVMFLLLAAVFAYLAFGEMRSLFAPVQPDWLPVLGVVVMLIMLVQALGRFLALWATSSIEFDRRNRLVRIIRRPTGVIRQIPFEKLTHVLISERARRQVRNGSVNENAEIEQTIGEAWIHIRREKGDYVPVAYLPDVEGHIVQPSGQPSPARRPLADGQTDCPAFRAAIRMAEMIEIPVYLETKPAT